MISEEGEELGTYTGAQPRDAAMKAASRGVEKIILREKGTKKLHLFRGNRERVSRRSGSPSWLPENFWRARVQKMGIRHLDYSELARNSRDLFRFPEDSM